MSGISTAARRELVESGGARYRSAAVDDKRRMLDEFVAILRRYGRLTHLCSAGTGHVRNTITISVGRLGVRPRLRVAVP